VLPGFPLINTTFCATVPAGIYILALDSRFLQASSQQEAAVMARHLGVAAPSAAAVYRDVLLPQLPSLPEAVRDAAMLRMLRCLGDLQQQDRGFTQLLAQVGTAAAASVAGNISMMCLNCVSMALPK
jgi:hypothetical protein